MNGWILAGTIMVGLAIVASLALALRDARSQRKAERAGFLKRIDTLNENILTLAGERNTALAERDKQAKRMDAALRERDEAIHLYNGLQTRFDAIRAEIETLRSNPVPPTDGAVKKSRSRTKPPAPQE